MCADWHRLLTPGAALAAFASFGAAQGAPSPADVATAVREYRVAHEQPIIQELVDLLAIPNIASDEPNIRRNADRLRVMLERRGFSVRFFEVPTRGPIIFADLSAPGAARTVVFYAHYDGQPTDPKAWTGTGPFEPGLRTDSIEAGGALRPFPGAGTPYQDDWRIYARSASDDKSPIVALLAAVDALAAKGIARAVNLRVVLDSEEENGSPGAGAGARRAPRPRARRRARHRRRPRAPVRTPARVLRQPRRVRLQPHRLRPGARPAQRPLRQLGAEPGDAAGAACWRP